MLCFLAEDNGVEPLSKSSKLLVLTVAPILVYIITQYRKNVKTFFDSFALTASQTPSLYLNYIISLFFASVKPLASNLSFAI